MKKKLTKVTATTIAAVALFTSGVYAANNWPGSGNVTNIKDNLAQISLKMDELKSENGDSKETIREIEILLEQETQLREQRERELADKQTEIENKIVEINEKIAENIDLKQQLQEALQKANQVDGLKAEVEQLKKDKAILTTENNNLNNQLDQALKDVQEIEQITEAMIE